MNYELQRGGLWKRIAAGLFDGILVGVLTVGIAFLLSLVLNVDSYTATVEEIYADYEQAFDVRFEITQEEYEAFTDAERQNYEAAIQALNSDEDAQRATTMSFNLSLTVTTFSVLVAILVWEFLIPLKLGQGRTLGKKIFGLCLMRTDSVAMNTMQLFTRTLLGKFTIETMMPVLIVMMIFWGIMDITGTLVLIALAIAQLLICALTRTNALIHDLLAGTVVVDYTSQMIFSSTEDLIAYQKKIAADRAARQTY